MQINKIFSLLIISIINLSICSIPNDLFFKINKDGSKKILDELLKEKYIAQGGDNFEINIPLLFQSPDCEEILKSIFKLGIDANIGLINEENSYYNLLDTAIIQKNIKIASFLIENGADVNAIDGAGFSPLVYAVLDKFKEGINLLIKHGASINTKYNYGSTILAFTDDVEITELLIQHGARFDEVLTDGTNRALFNAVSKGNEEVVRVLLKHGLNITNQVEALKWAIRQPSKSMVEILIKGGVDINAKDKDRNMPLAIAVSMLKGKDCLRSGKEFKKQNKNDVREIIELLLIKGANPNATFSCGMPALEVAKSDKQTYLMLLDYGANEMAIFELLKA